MSRPMLAKAVGDQCHHAGRCTSRSGRLPLFGVPPMSRSSCRAAGGGLLPPVPRSRRCLPDLPAGTTLDGELVIVGDSGLRFDLLSNRIRPARRPVAGRFKNSPPATPAQYVAFDVLRWQGEDVSQRPFAERRQILEIDLPSGVHSPHHWRPSGRSGVVRPLRGAGLDGVVCKSTDQPTPENG